MRRKSLPPPAPVHLEEVALGPPVQATRRARRWFDPVRGWFRRTERAASHGLARHVFPHVPGIAAPYGFQLRRHLTVAEAEIPLRRLHPALDGLTILFVSDLHASPFVSAGDLSRVFEKLVALRPDLILLGGDFATSRVEEVDPHLPWLGALRAPLGVFAVLGNHDHYTGEPEKIVARIEGAGIPVLQNRAAAVRRNGGSLVLAGVDDWNHGAPDLARALGEARRIDGAGVTVLLSHNPDAFFDAARGGVDLVLSGHTHGGQVRIPGLPVLVRMSRYRLDEGRFRFGDSQLVVSRGLGVCGIPLRLACPPEALFVVLRSRPNGG